MQNKNDDLGYPVEWGTEKFPHPNPFFPDVPRPLRGIGCLPTLLIFPGLPVALGYGMSWLSFSGFQVAIGVIVLAVPGLIYFLLNLNERSASAKTWKKNRIIPAVLIEAPSGPQFGGLISALMPLPWGILASILFSRTNSKNLGTFQYYLDGAVHFKAFEMKRSWDSYALGDYIWLINTKKSKATRLGFLPPKRYTSVKVPDSAIAWLSAVMPHEEISDLKYQHPFDRPMSAKDDKARMKEIKNAAKANSRAMKRELQYGETKRP